MIRVRVKHNGDEIARDLRRANAKLRRGLAAVPREAARQTVKATRQRASQLGGVHRHVVPGINLVGASTIQLDARRQPAIYGAVWGGGRRPTTRQFPPYRGSGYMLIPQFREEWRTIDRAVNTVLDGAL